MLQENVSDPKMVSPEQISFLFAVKSATGDLTAAMKFFKTIVSD